MDFKRHEKNQEDTAMSRNESTAVERRGGAEVAGREDARHRRTFSPSVDIVETQDELVVHADMPGVGGENIDIHFEAGELLLHGRVKDRAPEHAKPLAREYGVGDFYRVFTISEEVDAEKISAEYRNGVLTLRLPKLEAAKPRKIQVVAK